MIKKILTILLLIVVCAGVGGYFYVTNIDWNKHKNVIANRIYDATGKKIVFSGPLSLSFLPTPILSASNVKIINENTREDAEPLMTIKSLEAELYFMPLLKGQTNVKFVSLVGPKINIIKDIDGNYNWLKNTDSQAIEKIRAANLVLNSLTVQQASLYFEDELSGKKIALDNLNAEVLAPSLLGPYNIDGTYLKGDEPSGFSISLGELSSRFATTLNFALSYPKSQTAIRFDGSFLTENSSFTGDVIFSSKQLKNFADNNLGEFVLDNAYDYPLTFNFEVAYNKEKTAISNFVFEYGSSKGAGNLLIPHNIEGRDTFIPKLVANVNLTDFDATPLVGFVTKTIKQKGQAPVVNVDFAGSFNALKTTYNNQIVKDFKFDIEANQSIFSINDLSATLPEESTFACGGEFYYDDSQLLTYSFDIDFKTDNLYNILTWLKINPTRYSENTYKKASVITKLEGNTEQIKIFDTDLLLDKTIASGNVGIIVGARNNFLLDLELNNLNVDDYLKPIENLDEQSTLLEAIDARLKSLEILKNIDAQVNAKLNLLTISGQPFEKTDLSIDALFGEINVNNFSVKNFGGAELLLSGKVKNYTTSALLDNFKFSMQTNNVAEFRKSININTPFIKTTDLGGLKYSGIISGGFNNFNTKIIAKFNDFIYTYTGNIKNAFKNPTYKGALSLQSADFLRFAQILGFDYKPETFSLGTFNLNAEIDGNEEKMQFNNAKIAIGSNNFDGSISYEKKEKPYIVAKLDINKFDTQRFFYIPHKANIKPSIFDRASSKKSTFLPRPIFDRTPIIYDFYKTFNLDASFNIADFDVEGYKIKDANIKVEVKDNTINISEFVGTINQGQIDFNSVITMDKEPKVKGVINIKNQPLSSYFDIPTSVYAINAKSFSVYNTEFETSAVSFDEAFNNLTSQINISFLDFSFKGFDFNAVKNDLIKRDVSNNIINDLTKALNFGSYKQQSFDTVIDVNNSNFRFANKLGLTDEDVGLSINGSLKEWSVELEAVIKFLKDAFLPEYSLKLEGSLNTPKLSLDIKNIVKMLDDRQDEFKRQSQLRIEEDAKKMQGAMDNVQLMAGVIIQDINAFKNNEIKISKDTAFDKKLVKEYEKIYAKANIILQSIDEVTLQKNAVDFSNELIEELEAINAEANKNINQLKLELEKVQINDTTKKIEQVMLEAKEDNSVAEKINKNILEEYYSAKKNLEKMSSSYALEDDLNVGSFRANILALAQKINEEYNKIIADIKNISQADNLVLLSDTFNKVKIKKEGINLNMKNLLDLQTQAATYLAAKMDDENKIYQEKEKQKEIAAKIKENTATISVEDKGVMTLKKDIEEIIKEEKEIKSEELKVLDFSKPNAGVEIQTKTPVDTSKGVIKISN